MLSDNDFLGCSCGVDDLRTINDRLNAKVMEQVNETQELIMINSFAREANEYHFKSCLQDRISDIASWRWVFEDLSKRLDEAIRVLRHEQEALGVVVQRIKKEIQGFSREASKPGALTPMVDHVEKAILEENNFLVEEKKNFEKMLPEIEKQIKSLVRTRKRIQDDILKKQEALTIENSCANTEINSVSRKNSNERTKRKRFSSLTRWENRCVSLKRIGLQALSNTITTRQQVRGARVRLSIVAQAYSAKVDAALRKRIHTNVSKLEELTWQRNEALRDLSTLNEELTTTEQNLLETMEQEKLIAARLADRSHRPPGEVTKDEVDRRLRDELGRLKHFMKHLRNNIDRINNLQNKLGESLTRIDCYAEDLTQVLHLDQERINQRSGDTRSDEAHSTTSQAFPNISQSQSNSPLTSIKEEDEEGDDGNDDYPFDD